MERMGHLTVATSYGQSKAVPGSGRAPEDPVGATHDNPGISQLPAMEEDNQSPGTQAWRTSPQPVVWVQR